jgi:hypothetical protein
VLLSVIGLLSRTAERRSTGAPVLRFMPGPTDAEIEKLASVICERVSRMLRRKGLLGQASHESNAVEAIDAATDASRRAALSRGRSLQGRHIDEMRQRVEPSFGFRFRSYHYLQQSW